MPEGALVWRARLLSAAAALSLGAAVAFAHPSREVLLLVGIAAILAAPAAVRFATGALDLLEPIQWLCAAFGVMFVATPAALLAYDDLTFHTLFDIAPGLDKALVVALVGSASVVIGYAIPLGRHLAASTPRISDPDVRVFYWAGVLLVLAGLGGYALFATRAQVPVAGLLWGGPRVDSAVASAYLYQAPFLAIPGALLLLAAGLISRRRRVILGSSALAVLISISLAVSGFRLWLLLLLSSLIIYPLLRTGRRPPAALVVAVAVPAVLIAASLREVTQEGGVKGVSEAIVSTASDPERAVRETLTGDDTEMVGALAVEVELIPSRLPHEPGLTAVTLVTHPVPRSLWPEKPNLPDGRLNEFLFGSWGVRASDPGVAFSLLGAFYWDSGLIGVFLGMSLVGVGLRFAWEYVRRHSLCELAMLIHASVLPLIVVLARGNLPDTFSRALFTLGPLVVLGFVTRSLKPRL